MLVYIIKIFIINKYFIVYTDFNSFMTCFYIFMILKLRYYILNLDLSFIILYKSWYIKI